MNIEQFELILCDMYTMDAWSPPLLWKWKKEFKEASTKQWAIRELENYIRKRLHHRSDVSNSVTVIPSKAWWYSR